MEQLLKKVEKELHTIGEKGITNANLDATFKLIDIYKDIKESCYYDYKTKKGEEMTYSVDEQAGTWEASGSYGTREASPLHGRMHKYTTKIKNGVDEYLSGETQEDKIAGISVVMETICSFVEELYDYASTEKEKEVIKKHIHMMKNW